MGARPPVSVASGRAPGHAQKLARIVLRRMLRLGPRESVVISAWSEGLPWARATAQEAGRIGARTTLILRDEQAYWRSTERRRSSANVARSPAEWALFERANALVYFWGPSDALRDYALPLAIRKAQVADWARLTATARRTGQRIALLFHCRVSDRVARQHRITTRAWSRELYEATLVSPELLQRRGERLAEQLRRANELRIDHPNGTHLTLRLRHREPEVFAGQLGRGRFEEHHRARPGTTLRMSPVPTGYVTVAPDEEFAEGQLVSNAGGYLNWPDYAYLDRARWKFRGGRLVSHTFRTGGEAFDRLYGTGGAGRDQPGALVVGLNPRIRFAPWMQDQSLGAFSLGIGGNRHVGGTLGTDFRAFATVRGGVIRLDGKVVLRGGRTV